MQRLVYLVSNGGVEFVQEIEPRLGDETKNLSAIIGRAFPARELLLFEAIQQAGYTRCLFDHLFCDVQCRKPSQACPSEDSQDVELLRGDTMLIEDRCTKTVQIIGGAQDAYNCVLLARMHEVLPFCFAVQFCFHLGHWHNYTYQ